MVRPWSQSSVAVAEHVSPSVVMLAIRLVNSIIALGLLLKFLHAVQPWKVPGRGHGCHDDRVARFALPRAKTHMAPTHRRLNRSVELTESSYQQAFARLFRIILASGYEMVSTMTLA